MDKCSLKRSTGPENKDTIMTCQNSYDGHVFNITDDQLKQALSRVRDKDDNSTNGLITKIWGPPTWKSFHAVQFGYPMKPTEEEKADYKAYFTLLGKVLPCEHCRKSYQEFIGPGGDVELTDGDMESRETLTRWGFRLRDRVNKKLGIDYGTTYEELCYEYESYRARCTKTENGCITPLDMKSKAYQNADIKRAPVIDPKYAKKLIPHAKTLGLTDFKAVYKQIKKTKRNSEEWMVRDILCCKLIKRMRSQGISSLDESGLPSYYEMILISMLSTNLEEEQLEKIYNMLCNEK